MSNLDNSSLNKDFKNIRNGILELKTVQLTEGISNILDTHFRIQNGTNSELFVKITKALVYIYNESNSKKIKYAKEYQSLIADYLGTIFSYLYALNAENLELLLLEEVSIISQILDVLMIKNDFSHIETMIEVQLILKELLERWVILTKRNYYDENEKYRTTSFIKKTLRGDIRYFFILVLGAIHPIPSLEKGMNILESYRIHKLIPKRNTLNTDSLLLCSIIEKIIDNAG